MEQGGQQFDQAGTRPSRRPLVIAAGFVTVVVVLGAAVMVGLALRPSSDSTTAPTAVEDPGQEFTQAEADRLATGLGSQDPAAVRGVIFPSVADAAGATLTTLVPAGTTVTVDRSTWQGNVDAGAGTVQAQVGSNMWTLTVLWDGMHWELADSVQGVGA